MARPTIATLPWMAVLVLVSLGSDRATAAPAVVGTLSIPGGARVTSMRVVDNTAYLAMKRAETTDLLVVDLRDPSHPVLSPEAAVELQATVHDIAVLTDHAYLATSDDTAELVVVDLKAGRIVGRLDTPGASDGLSIRATASEDTKIVWLGTTNHRNGEEAHFIDVSDPKKPSRSLSFEGFEDLENIALPRSMAGYSPGGPIIARGRLASDSALTVLAIDAPERQLRILTGLDETIMARDRNGDGTIHIACLGDSNTYPNFGQNPASWCVYAGQTLWHRALEFSTLAAMGHQLTVHGAEQLDAAIARDADLAIFAFGTNDVAAGKSSASIVAEMRALATRATDAEVDVLFATIPPRYDSDTLRAAIKALNAAIGDAFPAERLIDFWTGFTSEHFLADGVHVNRAGTRKRGVRVVERLRP